METKKLGQFIRSLRKEKKLTQDQLAEALFVSGKTVSRWETGSSLPDLMMLQNIADYFGVGILELIDGERQPAGAGEEKTAGGKETVKKLSEYSSNKERRIARRLGLCFGLVLLGLGLIAGFFRLRQQQKEMRKENDLIVTGRVTHYAEREDGSCELYLLCDGVRLIRFLVTADTRIGSESLKKRILARETELELVGKSVYTKKEMRAAERKGEEFVYPALALEPADPTANDPVPGDPVPGDPVPALQPADPIPPEWKPLADLKEGYSRLRAEADGCVILDGVSMAYGETIWLDFLAKTRQGKPAAVRVYQISNVAYNQEREYFVKQLVFDGTLYHLSFYDHYTADPVWFLVEESYRCLNEETRQFYERQSRGYLLADDPSAVYSEYMDRLASSRFLPPDPRFDHVHIVFLWDITDYTEVINPVWEAEMEDIDGNGEWERVLLGQAPGSTPGRSSFALQIYSRSGTRLYSETFLPHSTMQMSFVRQDGRLCVQGITLLSSIRPETHLYQIVLRDGKLALEENGQALPVQP